MKPAACASLLISLLIALSKLHSTSPARAQSSIELENVRASVQFGEQIVFSATVTGSAPLQDVSIVIFEEPQGITHVEPVRVQEDGHMEFHLDAMQSALRPFTTVQWHYRFTFQDGTTAQSETFFVRYLDNRFEWQTVEAAGLRVSWYGAEAEFGQAALDTARAGLESIGRFLTLDLTTPVEVYLYKQPDDLRATLALGGEDWIVGHADPALGVMMVAIEPGAEQGNQMEQRIPHELMHVMLYRRVGAGYRHIPVWLREGMGTLAELYPNPDHARVLDEAVRANHLIPFQELCTSFPAGAGQAFLAYSQSRSFTQYLLDTYGSTEILSLALSYGEGASCESGPERVFGAPLSQLEADWRASISSQNSFLPALQNIAPYLVLLCLVLIIPLIGMASTFRTRGNRNGRETYVRK